MALFTVLTRDSGLRHAVRGLLWSPHHVAGVRSWERLLWLLRERPVTGVVLDGAALDPDAEPAERVSELKRSFPSVGAVFVHRAQVDPFRLFHLGRARAQFDGLALVGVGGLAEGLRAALIDSTRGSTLSVVLRAIGPRLSRRELEVIRLALEGIQVGWGADDLARRVGLTRAHLSVRLRSRHLPSAGHLLLWARLLHASRWLSDPGRSAESVSRQLGYANGAVFRRALRNYLGRTPSEIRASGGLTPTLDAFLDACGLRDSVEAGRSVA